MDNRNEIDNNESHATESSAKRKLHELKDKVSDFRDHATDYVKNGYSKAREKSALVEDKVVTYTRENPIKAIGISVLVGAVVAKLLRSRK